MRKRGIGRPARQRAANEQSGPGGASRTQMAIVLLLLSPLLAGCLTEEFEVFVYNDSGQAVWVELVISRSPEGNLVFFQNVTLDPRRGTGFSPNLAAGSYLVSARSSNGPSNQTTFDILRDIRFLAPTRILEVSIFPDRIDIRLTHAD